MKKLINYKFQNWMIALILIFVLSMIGLGISLFIGIFIPFWILLVFSLIYSVEKWFSYITRKHKYVGKLYRLFLNLSILSLLGLLVWSGIKLFSQELVQSSLIGSIIFIAEFIFFIWLWRVISKNSWRWPSMKLTVVFLLAVTIIFAFAGVQPVSSYKDDVISKWNTYWAEQKVKNEEKQAQAIIEEQKRAEEQAIEEQRIAAEQKVKEEQARIDELKRIEEQEAKEAQIQAEFNQNFAQLFNDFRRKNGKTPLIFDPRLNELARQRVIEISQPGNFSHEGIEKYNLGENIAMMAYSSDSNESLLEQWANSPGHRSNMLASMYYRTGFARAGRYAVQIFD